MCKLTRLCAPAVSAPSSAHTRLTTIEGKLIILFQICMPLAASCKPMCTLPVYTRPHLNLLCMLTRLLRGASGYMAVVPLSAFS